MFGLVFMGFAVIELLTAEAPPAVTVLDSVSLLLIAACYVATPLVADAAFAARWGIALGLAAMVLLRAAWVGWDFANLGVYPAVVFAALLPWRQSRVLILVWSVALIGLGLAGAGWVGVMIGCIAFAVGVGMGVGMETGRLAGKLQRAEQRVATLAVAAERERIGRDLHDILGHSLTAITLKSSLAARLASIDPGAAEAQMREVERLSREALADVRATASGLADVRVASELASARSILVAAGIEAYLPVSVEPMPDEVSRLFGYVIREGLTNVVRHSGATTCTIDVTKDRVVVSDNGRGPGDWLDAGRGLAGLRDRLALAGGVLRVDSSPTGGTVVEARIPTRPGTRSAAQAPAIRAVE